MTHTKFAGNGPAVASWKAIETGTDASFVNSAPPAATTDVVGFVRSIVVAVRLPWFTPSWQELEPSGK